MYVSAGSVRITGGAFLQNKGSSHFGLPPTQAGGAGIYIESAGVAEIDSVRFEGNSREESHDRLWGGAIHCRSSQTTTVRNCDISGSSVGDFQLPGRGGGVFAAGDLRAFNCRFIGNGGAQEGGGAYGGQYEKCLFMNNFANWQGGGAWGIHAVDSLFTDNRASLGKFGQGGGVAFSELVGCFLARNTAQSKGGGAYESELFGCTIYRNFVFGYFNSPPGVASGGGLEGGTATDCVIVENEARRYPIPSSPNFYSTGGGAFDSELERCVLVGNIADVGGGFYRCNGSQLTLVQNLSASTQVPFAGGTSFGRISNSIVWNNLGPGAPFLRSTAVYSDLGDPVPGPGNISVDPLFVGPVPGYLALQSGSPCIDAGDPALTDPDGSRIDMGARPFELPMLPQPITFCSPNALCPSSIGWTGSASLAGPKTLTVFAGQVPSDQFGLLVLSRFPYAPKPLLDGGSAVLCLAGPYVRMPVQRSTGGAPCDGSFRQEVLPTALHRLGLTVGDSLHAQYWFRSPGPAPFGVERSHGDSGCALSAMVSLGI